MEEAHIFAFGDSGSVLMAVYNEGPTDEIRWSLDHGKTWKTTGLEEKIKARLLTTTPDATALTFLLYGNVGGGRKLKHVIYAFDFGGMHERTCKEEDFEQWYARTDEGGKRAVLWAPPNIFDVVERTQTALSRINTMSHSQSRRHAHAPQKTSSAMPNIFEAKMVKAVNRLTLCLIPKEHVRKLMIPLKGPRVSERFLVTFVIAKLRALPYLTRRSTDLARILRKLPFRRGITHDNRIRGR